MSDKRPNRTTIQISQETLKLLRKSLRYNERNGRHYLETYNDLLCRMLNLKHKYKNSV